MKKRNIPIAIFLLIGGSCLGQSTSPQVLATAGGEGSSTTNHMSWTIGEAVIETVSDGGNTLTQGFHQPWADVTIGVSENAEFAAGVTVYPNPARHILHVVYDEAPHGDHFELRDALGRLLMQDRILDSTTDLDMTALSTGNYFLRLLDSENTQEKTFTINVTH